MADVTISDLTAAVSIDGSTDYIPIDQGGVTKKINRNVYLGVTGTPADISTAQNFTNKTLNNTNTVTLLDTLFTLQDNSVTTKQVQFNLTDISSATTRTFRFPDISDILVTESATQGMTNKTLTSPTINGGTITNTTISVNTIAEYTAANGVTIDGLNIKDGKLNTNNSVVTANITDAAVTPAKLVAGTGASWAWQSWTPTWTNFTVGNASTSYKYTQIGKTVFFEVAVTMGNTSSMGTTPTFTLPVTAAANYNTSSIIGSMYMFIAASFIGKVFFGSATTAIMYVENTASTYNTIVSITAAVPAAWGTNSNFFLTGFYEAA